MANPTAEHADLSIGSALVPLVKVVAPRIGEIIYFTNSPMPDGSFVKYKGITYLPIPHAMTQMEEVTSGLYPKLRITVSDANRVISGLLTDTNTGRIRSLSYADFYYSQVYAKHLDGGSSPNINKSTPELCFKVDNMIEAKWGETITWQLKAPYDLVNVRIPGETYTEEVAPAIGRALTR